MGKYRNMLRIFASVLLCLGMVLLLGSKAEAAPAIDTSPLHGLSGDAGYIEYADNYYLDMEETGFQDFMHIILNGIANGLFGYIKGIGEVVVMLFYYCMDFDLAELFSKEITAIQSSLNNGVFKPLFTLAFCGSAVYMLKKFLQHNIMGTFGEVLKALGIYALSLAVVTHSAEALSGATSLTKAVSTQILVGMQNDGTGTINKESYAKTCAGILWTNLVHEPWMLLEFGSAGSEKIEDDFVKDLMSYAVGTENREKLIEKNSGLFPKSRAGERCSFLLLYLMPFVIKCVIYIVLAVFMLAYQLLAVFFVLLAPIILLLAMIPGYERIVGTWLKKLLESQLGILILSFVMGLLVKLDDLTFSKASSFGGWLLVIVVQTVIDLVVIFKRNELLGMLGKLQRAGGTARYADAMLRSTQTNAAQGSVTAAKAAVRGGIKAGRTAVRVSQNACYALAEESREEERREQIAAYREERENSAEAAGSGGKSNPQKKGAVDRPVLSMYEQQKAAKRSDGSAAAASRAAAVGAAENLGDNAADSFVSAQEPQTEAERPRLDNWNIIRVEPVEGHIERVGEGDGETASVSLAGASQTVPAGINMQAAAVVPAMAGRSRAGAGNADHTTAVRPRLDMPKREEVSEQKREQEVPRPAFADMGVQEQPSDKTKTAQIHVQSEGKTGRVSSASAHPHDSRGCTGSRIQEKQSADRTSPVSRPSSSVAEKRIVLINKATDEKIAEVVTDQDMTVDEIMEAYGWEFNNEKRVWQMEGEEDIAPEDLE